MVYGDRDYQCNWLGGEAISLAIKSSSTSNFAAASYAEISTNDSYVGGLVRQHSNLSFSRVYQAGHEGKQISVYQGSNLLTIDSAALSTGNCSSDFQQSDVRYGCRDWEGWS
jgi:hypothetical protein